jgi:hypothetical protein
MDRRIEMTIGDVRLHVNLRDTPAARAVYAALPLDSYAERWGDEIYLEISVRSPLERDASAHVAVGDVAYWPDGPGLALFFGRTAWSTGDEPRAASAVNVIGRFDCDPALLRGVRAGAKVHVEAETGE